MKKKDKIVTESKETTATKSTPDLAPQTAKDKQQLAKTDPVSDDQSAITATEQKSTKTGDKPEQASTDSKPEKTSSAASTKSDIPAKTVHKKQQKPLKPPTKSAVDTAQARTETKERVKNTATTEAKLPPSNTAETKQSSNKSAVLALVIAITALGFSGFQYYQSIQTNSAAASANAQLKSLQLALSSGISSANDTANSIKSAADESIAKAQTAIQSVNTNLVSLQQAEVQKSNDIAALQARLTKSIQQVEASGLQQNTRKDWLLAEVEYLLRLANQRVLMENTPIGAIALLKSADSILQQTDDVSIFSVRKSLAADIAALSAVPVVDQEGLYLKIDALSAQINQLKLVPVTDKKQLPSIIDSVATEAVADAQQSSFAKIWDKASSKLQKLVVIRHRDSAIEPLLSSAQQAALLQNLHILFEQTQLALLQRKQLPYQRSIEKAELIIQTHFQAKDGTSQALLKGLQTLKEQQISVPLPSIAGSLNTLKAYVKQSSEIKAGVQGQ